MEVADCVRCGKSFPVSLGVHLCEEDRGQRPLRGIGFHCSWCTAELLRGRIAYDPETGGPCAVVDGRKLDWETLGELLLSREEFSFRLEFFYSTDEIP